MIREREIEREKLDGEVRMEKAEGVRGRSSTESRRKSKLVLLK